jgi:hypothetical protein
MSKLEEPRSGLTEQPRPSGRLQAWESSIEIRPHKGDRRERMKMNILRSMSKDHRIRPPFQGEFLLAKAQAWKAWATVSNRFAVEQLRC